METLTRREFGKKLCLLATGIATGVFARPPEALGEAEGATSHKRGNLDRFIGLKRHQLVIATGRHEVTVYKSYVTKQPLTYFQKKSCVVVDTSRLTKGHTYTWVKVKLQKGCHGFVKLEDVKLSVLDTKNFGMDLSKPKNRLRAAVCRYGFKYIGSPWRWNGESYTTGIGCNNFAFRAFTSCGVKLLGRSSRQLHDSGKPTSFKRLKPGDIICWINDGNPRHIAISLGGEFMIESAGTFGNTYPYGGVRVSTIYSRVRNKRYRNIIG